MLDVNNPAIEAFEKFMNFSNKKMLRWAADYFQKKGVAKVLEHRNSTDEVIKKNIIKQASLYFNGSHRNPRENKKLSRMKSSWRQFSRRKQNAEKPHTISVDNEIYLRLKAVKNMHNLKNFSQVIGSIIDGEVRKREQVMIDQANITLQNKLKKSKEFEERFHAQKALLEELKNKIDLLEKNNTTLTDTIQTLNSVLNIDSTPPKIE